MSLISRIACTTALAVAATVAQAAPLRVSASGVYDASAPASFFTAAGATWEFSFLIDSHPVPLTDPPGVTESGQFTTVPFSDFVYRLNGVAIAEAAVFASFYNNVTNSGGLDINFNDFDADPLAPTQALSFYGPQMYSGDEFTPTFLPGSYDTYLGGFADSFFVVVDGVEYGQGDATIVIGAVPLPGSAALALLALGLAGAAGLRAGGSGRRG